MTRMRVVQAERKRLQLLTTHGINDAYLSERAVNLSRSADAVLDGICDGTLYVDEASKPLHD